MLCCVPQVIAHGASARAIFVAGCTWESVNLSAPLLSHAAIVGGGTLECWMSEDASHAAWVDPEAIF
eukprot:COSAG01_NODE_4972_length_4567_cov_8.278509_1_plen_67_part_00